jgi:type VI secretion system FHA domain protein
VQPAPAAEAPFVHAAPAAGPAAETDLLRAFLEGAGVPDLDVKDGLTPETMRAMGQLLREATQGTLDLLLSRAVIKREMHAEMTMIVTGKNNPLKFSPNVEVALAHLLAPRGQGFMPPLEAMQDAYDDLRAHQFAFMAGMRAALAHVLARFDPATLEGRLSEKSLVDALLPANRKARLWALYADMYADITREAEDDFDAWFGKAFLKAYAAQLDKLERVDRAEKAEKAGRVGRPAGGRVDGAAGGGGDAAR